MSTIEYKFLPATDAGLSLKSDEGRPVVVAGYASVFGPPADSYGDLISPGAYARTIRDWQSRSYPLPMLVGHDGLPVGKWVMLREDPKGLWVEGELTPGHSVASDVAASMRHGALSGLSIGFKCKKASLDHAAKTRSLEDIDLFEISAVTSPACDRARVAAVKAAGEPDVEAAIGHLRRASALLVEPTDAASLRTAYGTVKLARGRLRTGEEPATGRA